MEKVKKRNRSIALIAAFILLTLTVRPGVAYGAIGIDTDAKCSITFDLSTNGLVIQKDTEEKPEAGETGNTQTGQNQTTTGDTQTGQDQTPAGGTQTGQDQTPVGGTQTGQDQTPAGGTQTTPSPGFEELEKLLIEVELYKVADVNVSGRYVEPKVANKTLYNALSTELSGVNSDKETMARAWETMAKKAQELVDKKIEEEAPIETAATTMLNSSELEFNQSPDGEKLYITENGKKINNLSTGLYLVIARDAKSAQYIYHFSPYLVSLPGNNYGRPDAQGNPSTDDTWQPDVTVGLKPGRENRYGDLKIVKTLNSYNATLGGATFIFRIESEPKDGISYSDVVSITFDNAGTKEYLLAEKIPAGAKVTVTEVYTGASYEVTSDSEKTATIVASDPDDPNNPPEPNNSPDAPEPGNPATVDFTNDYDERLNKGTSIVNLFEFTKSEDNESEGVWNWVDPNAPNPEPTNPEPSNPEPTTPEPVAPSDAGGQ